MTDPGKTTRRRFWFDPRFAIGLVLVAASVVGVYVIVANAERSTAVYAARSSLAVGDRIHAADLVTTDVRFGGARDLYITPARMPRDGLLVTRTVAAGELLPASAVGTRAGASVTSVVVMLHGALAAAVVPGSVVDVWAARQSDSNQFGAPAVLVEAAAVVRIIDATGFIASGSEQSAEILVPKSQVAAVLESAMNGDSIALVSVNAAVEK